VDIPPAAVRQRRLASYAQILQSHALAFFHLASPDFLAGLDAEPQQRHLFALAAQEPEFLRRGIRLRQFGQRTIELVGGKRVHPGWAVPGGVTTVLPAAALDELRPWMSELHASVAMAISRLKSLFVPLKGEIEAMGHFPSLFLGLVNEDGNLEYYHGKVRVVDSEGNVVAAALEPHRYLSYVGEASESWTYVKPTFYKALGYPGGMYRVGPLARLNVAKSTGTPRADKELKEFRQLGRAGVVSQSFHYHYARLIEMLHCVERIEELLEDPALLGSRIRSHAQPNHHDAVGCVEAPRGILWHQYLVDESGRVEKANLLIATQQNNTAMNEAVKQAAMQFVNPAALNEGMLNRVEAAIRCFDPCLSCSTHALGQMAALAIEVVGPDGRVLARLAR